MGLYEVKLELFYYGVRLTDSSYNSLKHDKNGNVNNDDYITTKGLFLILDNKTYVNAPIDDNSSYIIDYDGKSYFLYKNNTLISIVKIIQPADFALYNETLRSGELITHLINVHGDRLRIQPISGCAFRCNFCDLNNLPYIRKNLSDLDEAVKFAIKNVEFRHILISGGTPRYTDNDYAYLNEVYKYFGESYGSIYNIDVMTIPRGLTPKENNYDGYKMFLQSLKSWGITSMAINLELWNDGIRQKYIRSKDTIGKKSYAYFIKEAAKIFGPENIRSCIIVGLESIEDTLRGVEFIASLGVLPVLSPYVPIDDKIKAPTPKFMKEVLLKSKEITDEYGVNLGPSCDFCKHNSINFK